MNFMEIISDYFPCLNIIIGFVTSEVEKYWTPIEPFQEQLDYELNEWEVSTYAENPHLVKIPQERITKKREEIANRLSKEYQ